MPRHSNSNNSFNLRLKFKCTEGPQLVIFLGTEYSENEEGKRGNKGVTTFFDFSENHKQLPGLKCHGKPGNTEIKGRKKP